MKDMKELSRTIMDLARCQGASAVGVTTVDTLRGGPPSTDLTYVLPGAGSAVTFAVPLDQTLIEPYLMKKDHAALERHIFHTNSFCSGIAQDLAGYLEMKGFKSLGVWANAYYRKDVPFGILGMLPDISHRYLAVRSGVGFFGLSGNVITKEAGAAVLLGTAVTTAELTPTAPLSKEESYCDSCKLCLASCASGFMDKEEKVQVTLGGVEFSYSKRRDYNRCNYVCGGFSGLHSSGKWSTWSPGRFAIPKKDEEFQPALLKALPLLDQWPKINGGSYHPLLNTKLRVTCAHCQLICTPDKEERKKRLKMITEAGVVVQNQDGSFEALSPEAAKERIAAMSPEVRALYEDG
jgi:epoxyqueuosine reductase